MSLGYVYLGLMVVITFSIAAVIVKWMNSPNDRYDDLLEELAKGGENK